jgi:hypothetical protein
MRKQMKYKGTRRWSLMIETSFVRCVLCRGEFRAGVFLIWTTDLPKCSYKIFYTTYWRHANNWARWLILFKRVLPYLCGGKIVLTYCSSAFCVYIQTPIIYRPAQHYLLKYTFRWMWLLINNVAVDQCLSAFGSRPKFASRNSFMNLLVTNSHYLDKWPHAVAQLVEALRY